MSEILHDFETWVDGVDLDEYESVYCLYKSVEELKEWGGFNCTQRKNGDFIVTAAESDTPLRLATEKARDSFLGFLEKKYAQDMTMEGWFSFMHTMGKDD